MTRVKSLQLTESHLGMAPERNSPEALLREQMGTASKELFISKGTQLRRAVSFCAEP